MGGAAREGVITSAGGGKLVDCCTSGRTLLMGAFMTAPPTAAGIALLTLPLIIGAGETGAGTAFCGFPETMPRACGKLLLLMIAAAPTAAPATAAPEPLRPENWFCACP